METPHHKISNFVNNNSPLSQQEEVDDERELRNGGEYDDEDDYEETFTAGGCCCFRLFCFKSRRRGSNDYSARRILLQQQGGEFNRESNWFVERGKKLREISELVAGPKWKTFIRKIGPYYNNGKNRQRMDTKYDPQSYALNFDDGEEDAGAHLAEANRF